MSYAYRKDHRGWRAVDTISQVLPTEDFVETQPTLIELSPQEIVAVEIETAITADTLVSSLKAMTNVEFDAWWAANITNLSQANGVLKRIARIVLRRVL